MNDTLVNAVHVLMAMLVISILAAGSGWMWFKLFAVVCLK